MRSYPSATEKKSRSRRSARCWKWTVTKSAFMKSLSATRSLRPKKSLSAARASSRCSGATQLVVVSLALAATCPARTIQLLQRHQCTVCPRIRRRLYRRLLSRTRVCSLEKNQRVLRCWGPCPRRHPLSPWPLSPSHRSSQRRSLSRNLCPYPAPLLCPSPRQLYHQQRCL